MDEVIMSNQPLDIEAMLIQHNECDDPWYNCPKSKEGCRDEYAGTECNCGADRHNKNIKSLYDEVKSLRARVKELEANVGTVTVCNRCFQASCWQGKFHCDESRSAGTVEMLRSELAKLGWENPSYWEPVEPTKG